MAKWTSPAAAADMVFDDPARLGSGSHFGFAILWAENRGERAKTADLACAKLQPAKPKGEGVQKDETWAVTASDHRLLLAAGTPDIASPKVLFDSYDADVCANQNLLAVVQTLRFDPDLPRHTMMQHAYLYASLTLHPKRLSSLIVQHMPGDIRSARAPHVHILTLARVHRISGWGQVHEVFDDPPAEMHRAFLADWERFNGALKRHCT
ncbi:hypothetical protein SAMN06297144_1426 [Sphingomonas guangdongensis]|uniref:Uncharacterized protein n=1 Tax=Sphingomonas guangdongensis TaxID=1141890 RepID=A0A285QI45_9SPHN|nr:hypothetical protein [Sphingomonas guangdongensis]SOB81154.1 hypothetical protein SAMN06297144_1426 [Sphingomonas guangdongensis]